MSILLETLNHQDKEHQVTSTGLPNVHSSHYDDEMLGDEWLYQRLRLWRLLSLFLIVTLICSWSYFWFVGSKVINENQQHESNINQLSVNELTKTSDISESIKEPIQNKPNLVVAPPEVVEQIDNLKTVEEASPVASNILFEKNNQVSDKPAYVPQKRIVDKSYEQAKVINPNSNAKKIEKPKQVNRKKQNFELAIYKEELPDELLQQFPLIKINSYVVSDEAEKSFVILDGAFYKINQVIAIDLILRQITHEHIVVEFHDQLVKIKL